MVEQCLPISPQIIKPLVDDQKENEFSVSFLKAVGSYHIFPVKEDRAIVDIGQIQNVLEPPEIDNRGRYRFL